VSHFFTTEILSATLATGIALTAPFLLAALGETFGQRSGVLNLGVEGIMLLAAFVTYYTMIKTDNATVSIITGILTGVILGVVTAFISVTLKAQQGISGIGVYLFGLGLSNLLFLKLVGTPLPISPPTDIAIPILHTIPTLGRVFFNQPILVYMAFLLVPVASFILNRTIYGLKIRAVGENPGAVDTIGVSVAKVRWSTVLIGCTLAGLAGSTLVLYNGIFTQNLTQGAGFIAVALVYFGAWRPLGVMGGSLLYGLVAAIVLSWKSLGIIPLSGSNIAATAPAVITVLALLSVARLFRQPNALGQPYQRGG